MRIFLTGYMYSGKTTIGKKVARKLELPFYDLDDYFEIKYKISVTQFFEKYSEELFRKLETETLAELIRQEDNVLISTGGGTACFNHNMELMNASGLTVYVEMSPKSVFARMQASKKKRPLLLQVQKDKVEAFIEKHLEERRKYYRQSRLTIKGENADIDQISRLIRDADFLEPKDSSFRN